MHPGPPAFVEMLPPMVEIGRDAGSGDQHRPRGANAFCSIALMMPGWTTARSDSWSTETTRFMAIMSRTTVSRAGTTDPQRFVAAARGTTANPRSDNNAMSAATSSVVRGRTTAPGHVGPLNRAGRPARSSQTAAPGCETLRSTAHDAAVLVMTATELAGFIRGREVSAREVMEEIEQAFVAPPDRTRTCGCHKYSHPDRESRRRRHR